MIENIPLSLSPDQKEWLKSQVSQGGFTNTGEYLSKLIECEQLRQERERIEDLLEEGHKSASRPVTAVTWKRIRAKIQQAAGQKRTKL